MATSTSFVRVLRGSAKSWLPSTVGLLIALPWLNPFAPGPTPSVVPLLVSWASLVILLSLLSPAGDRTNSGWLGATVAKAWLAAALVSVALGLLQYFGWAHHASPWVHAGNLGEAFGNLRQRNQFATLTSIGYVALLWHVARFEVDSPSRTQRLRWWLWLGAASLLAVGNAASGSRTGLLQWCAVSGLAVWWWRLSPRNRRTATPTVWVAMWALGFYALAVFDLPRVLEWATGVQSAGLAGRFGDEAGCQGRRVLWANVLHLIAQRPFAGWGWGELDYAHFVTLYPAERFCDIVDNAHNLPLHLAVELGVPLAVLACGAFLWWVVRSLPWQDADATRQMAWGALAVIGLHSLVEYPLWYGPFQMAVVLAVVLLRRSSAHSLSQAQRPWVSAVCFAALVGLAYVGWDYWRISQLYLVQSQRSVGYQTDTLAKVRDSRFFRDQVEFAELTTTALTDNNAALIHALAVDLLHFSPEPRVIEKAIESAIQLHRDDLAEWYSARYRAAFAQSYADWVAASASHKTP